MNALIALMCEVNDEKKMELVLHALLTDKELEAIENRIQIIKKLNQNKTQRQISSELGVGIATVTRGALAFKEGKFEVLRPYLCK